MPRRRGDLRATLAASTGQIQGIGLQTGRRTTLALHPAPPSSGILFRWRRDPAHAWVEVAGDWRSACIAPFCSALTLPGGHGLLRTPEHLLAALAALSIDDVVAEVEGAAEVPILDGSAAPWCAAILQAGVAETEVPRSPVRLREPVEVMEDGRLIRAEPADELTFDVSIKLAGWGELAWRGSPLGETFVTELSPSRSFGRLRWALPLVLSRLVMREPVLRGARLSNTAPLVGGRILGGARVPDEPVRHRALDMLGDLALLGAPLAAHLTVRRPTHALAQDFVRLLRSRAEEEQPVRAG